MYKHNIEIEQTLVLLSIELENISKQSGKADVIASRDEELHSAALDSLEAELNDTLEQVEDMRIKRDNVTTKHEKLHQLLCHFIEVLKDNLPTLRGSLATTVHDISLAELFGIVEENVSEVAIANRLNSNIGTPNSRRNSIMSSKNLPVGPLLPKKATQKALHINPPNSEAFGGGEYGLIQKFME